MSSPLSSRHAVLLAIALASGAVVVLDGCTPSIGDKCVLSTDCSTRGDRLCDTSQPEGYCTQFNCQANGCPDEAACVLFNAAVPGCGYNDRAGASGSRVARSFCMGMCATNDDCRGGYICGDPKVAPWSGLILDIDQGKRVCLVVSTNAVDGGADANFSPLPPAPVCSPVAPDVPVIDASAPSGPEAGVIPPLVSPDSGIVDAGDAGDAADAGDANDGG